MCAERVNVRGAADLTTWRRDKEFREDPTPIVVLDPDLVIRAANPAYEAATGHSMASLESRFVFDAFPANPDDADGDDGPTNMAASFERVLRDGRPHDLVIQRYDIPDASEPGSFLTRTWLPQNVPVWGPDGLVGVATRAAPVDIPDRAQRVLRRFRNTLRDAVGSDDPDTVEMVDVLAWGLREYAAAVTEIGQLKEALTTRATIDQAKGVIMAERRMSPDDAFQVLVKLSNESNVRLAEVARALVYQVQRQER